MYSFIVKRLHVVSQQRAVIIRFVCVRNATLRLGMKFALLLWQKGGADDIQGDWNNEILVREMS